VCTVMRLRSKIRGVWGSQRTCIKQYSAQAATFAQRGCCPVHRRCRPKSTGLAAESSFGAMAVEADTMEDKLQLVQTKRRCVRRLANTLVRDWRRVCCARLM
jgi:hypothetical protein